MKFNLTVVDNVRDLYVSRDEPERFRKLSAMVWHLTLLVGGITVVLSLLYAAWELSSIFSPTPPGAITIKSAAAALNRVQLQAILDAFANRSDVYEKLKRNPPRLNDPLQ